MPLASARLAQALVVLEPVLVQVLVQVRPTECTLQHAPGRANLHHVAEGSAGLPAA
ncbi:MAG: hypothetical protein IPI32_08945 [Austwickia sp.]|nr:hypothetical protein [Austwickia sp.]MBK8436377.1 hypothetical protein [Austwickia sp.]MBK9102053.1 hypothetical protein [Austwickia sp.]